MPVDKNLDKGSFPWVTVPLQRCNFLVRKLSLGILYTCLRLPTSAVCKASISIFQHIIKSFIIEIHMASTVYMLGNSSEDVVVITLIMSLFLGMGIYFWYIQMLSEVNSLL